MIPFAVYPIIEVVQMSDCSIKEFGLVVVRGRGFQYHACQLASGFGDDGVDHEFGRAVCLLCVIHLTEQQPRVIIMLLLLCHAQQA
jgi:hypothetical protein